MSAIRAATRPAFRPSNFAFKASRQRFQSGGRRWQSTTAPAAEQISWFSRMWNSPVGLKTVHFWAPVMKWGIVLSGVADFYRPAEKLSLTQNLALTATGIIWTRWCFVIKPRNILLAAVNFFLGMVGVIQVSRIVAYNYSQKGMDAKAQLEAAKDDVVDAVESAEKQVEAIVKS